MTYEATIETPRSRFAVRYVSVEATSYSEAHRAAVAECDSDAGEFVRGVVKTDEHSVTSR